MIFGDCNPGPPLQWSPGLVAGGTRAALAEAGR